MKTKEILRKEALTWVLKTMVENPLLIKSIHIDNMVYNGFDVKKLNVDDIVNKDIWLSNSVFKKIYGKTDLFEIIKKEFNKDVRTQHLISTTCLSSTGKVIPIDFAITNHARERIVQRLLILWLTKISYYDINEQTRKFIESHIDFFMECVTNNSYHESINQNRIDKIIISFIQKAKVKPIDKLGNRNQKYNYAARERRYNSQTKRLVAHPLMFIMNANTKILTTIELYSSSFNYYRLNSIKDLSRRILKYKIQKIKEKANIKN